MTINVKKMTVKELNTLKLQIDQQLPIARQEAIELLQKEAERLGVSPLDAVKKKRGRKPATKVVQAKTIKGRFKDKNGLTWSGRGRKPKGWDDNSATMIV